MSRKGKAPSQLGLGLMDERVVKAVAAYWQTREGQAAKQAASGQKDQGARSAVTGGALMDSTQFISALLASRSYGRNIMRKLLAALSVLGLGLGTIAVSDGAGNPAISGSSGGLWLDASVPMDAYAGAPVTLQQNRRHNTPAHPNATGVRELLRVNCPGGRFGTRI